MKTFNLKEGMPSTAVAVLRLRNAIRYAKPEKIVKIIHGYGSHGVGGAIRDAARKELDAMLAEGKIVAYVPGEAVSVPMGFDDEIRRYRILLSGDPDFRQGNDGVTYVMLP
ncbi:MAG: Smr/MutS family protein [Candidatus Izemoplasmatales bacterium]